LPFGFAGCSCSKIPASGLARRAFMMDQLRKSHPGAFWVDLGDNVFDITSNEQWTYLVQFFQLMKYDALIFGDQEFSFAPETFSNRIKQSNLPWLATGIDSPYLKELPLRPFITRSKNGRSDQLVAWIGYSHEAAYQFFPGKFKSGLRFESLDQLGSRIQALKQKGYLVVMLSHSGYQVDRKIASGKSAPDLILTGHDQTLMDTWPQKIGKTYLVGTGKDGYYIGHLRFHQGKLVQYRMIPVPYETTPQHPRIKKWIDDFEKKNFGSSR